MFFFFKQKTAYEIVSRDWSSDVCSSDLAAVPHSIHHAVIAEMKKCIHGEGMPTFKNPFSKGDLIIKFTIDFPEDGFATEDQLRVSKISVIYSGS